MKQYLVFLSLALASFAHADLRKSIGENDLSDWSGVSSVSEQAAVIQNSQPISYTYSDQNRVYPGLLRDFYGDSADWYDYAGIAFEIYLDNESSAELSVAIKVDPLDYQNLNPISTAKLQLAGQGWQQVYVPWKLFDINMGQLGNTLQAVKTLEITATSSSALELQIRNVEVTQGEVLALGASIRGKATSAGGSVVYKLSIGNTTDSTQAVQVQLERLGWESMTASVQPSTLQLGSGEVANCTVTVDIPASLPSGIREKQVIRVTPNGDGSASESIELTTAVAVPTPNVVFTADKWQEVREKVERYDWAKDSLAEYEKIASNWKVSEGNALDPENPHAKSIFHKSDSDKLIATGIAYQVTGKQEYAEKCLQLFRRLNRDKDGYLVTERGGDISFVGEGVFFQGVTRAYDMIRDSDLITEDDHDRMEKTLRRYIERTIKGNTRGAISNWNVAELTAAVYAALALQDWHYVDHLLNSPTCIYAQIYHGIMS
ncbi:MAG: alginate lyase family protein, partial [Opitutales bacterium]|nr:alginate lyase family protein [Opitutales bacterium]